jgi:hypothetical protein
MPSSLATVISWIEVRPNEKTVNAENSTNYAGYRHYQKIPAG